jgi:hypothetical protein
MLTFIGFYLLISFVLVLLTIHLHWLVYACQEEDDEYYLHPIFEPDARFYYMIFGLLLLSIIAPIYITWHLFTITNRMDAMNIFIDKFGTERKKSNWRFWRWGIKKFPKSLSTF